MKKIINLFLFTIIMLSFSCEKQETIAYYTGATASVLTGTSNTGSTSISLKASDSTLTALSLNWTNPNYTYNYGVSSVDVSYLIEIDTSGSNFTNPNRAQIGITKDLGSVMTEGFLNSQLSNVMGLATSVTHNIQIRVTATIKTTGTNTNPVVSNVISFTATPYAPPPIMQPPSTYADNPTGTLYIVGSAVSGGWGNPIASGSIPIQKFTKVSNTLYQITIPLIGDGEYKLIGVNDGSWTEQWSIKTEQASGDPTTLGYSLAFNAANCRAPLASATYLIVVNFQIGTVSLTKQ
jgi:hypothetical protein